MLSVCIMTFGHALELVARVVAIYVALVVLLRLGGKRELAQMTPLDFLTFLLLSETVSPALTGGDISIFGGLITAGTLIGIALLVGWLTFRSRTIEVIIEGRAAILIKHGRVDREILRKHRITDQALRTALHGAGVVHVAEVAKAFIEPDGEITVIKAKTNEQ